MTGKSWQPSHEPSCTRRKQAPLEMIKQLKVRERGMGKACEKSPDTQERANAHENVHQKSTVRVHLSARADYKGQTSVCCCQLSKLNLTPAFN